MNKYLQSGFGGAQRAIRAIAQSGKIQGRQIFEKYLEAQQYTHKINKNLSQITLLLPGLAVPDFPYSPVSYTHLDVYKRQEEKPFAECVYV